MTTTVIRHSYAPLFDEREFTRRIVHDQQFMDLSERYDPIEATVDAHMPDIAFTWAERACLAGAFGSAILFGIAAYVC